jgi:hypothetical protein
MCGALGRASVKSGAANQRSLNMSTPSIATSRNLKTAASKKRSVKSSATARRKVTSAATTAKVPPKSDEPKVERVTKQERLLTLLPIGPWQDNRAESSSGLLATIGRVFGGKPVAILGASFFALLKPQAHRQHRLFPKGASSRQRPWRALCAASYGSERNCNQSRTAPPNAHGSQPFC